MSIGRYFAFYNTRRLHSSLAAKMPGANGALGGLFGLGGAEFQLPLLIGLF